ncbi:MAG: GxxExxY protein [Pyrinomonadaceae bacterium]
MEVHRNLGCGFFEPVYQEALAIEFGRREIPFQREIKFPVFYKEVRLESSYRPDFICFDGIVVELKALARVGGTEEAQIINYLKTCGREMACY